MSFVKLAKGEISSIKLFPSSMFCKLVNLLRMLMFLILFPLQDSCFKSTNSLKGEMSDTWLLCIPTV